MQRKELVLALLLLSLSPFFFAKTASADPYYQFGIDTTGYDIQVGETLYIDVPISNIGSTGETGIIQTSTTSPLGFIGRVEYSLSQTEVTLAPSESTTIVVTVTGTGAGGADLHISLYYNDVMQDSITLGFNVGTPGMYFIPGFPIEAILISLVLTLTAMILIRRKHRFQT